jgi:transcription termination factor Rho
MSGQGFDISLLEGKDRAELAAIAEQLGQKPSARAKKADIVSLIMRLVGADEPAPVADVAASTAAPADGPTSPADDADTGPGQDAPAAETADADAPTEADGDADGDEDDDEDKDAGAPAAAAGRQQSGRGDRGAPRQDRGPADQQRDANREQDPNRVAGGDRNQQGEGEAGDDTEPGNRRRRRRGRERRNDGDEQVQAEPVEITGMVDLREEGYGFLRLRGELPSRDDAYLSVRQTRQFGLRTGDIVTGKSRPANRNERNPALVQVDTVNGHPAHNQPPRPRFDELTAVFPDERLALEMADDPANTTVRIIDLVAPIGKGTRGLILSPPKAGKTTLLKQIVRSIEVNHPDVELFVLLVDERPEEVTDIERWLLRGTVAASAFDRPADEHVAIAELVVERAKRIVESGGDVVLVVDGLTSLTRAYSLAAAEGGRTLPGGIDASALHPAKRFFGAARKVEEGGSLTILATATVESGSAADEVIFDAFRATATMELKLDDRLAQRRVVPPIDVDASATRHEELLFERDQVEQLAVLRRLLGDHLDETGSTAAGIELLAERMAAHPTNEALLASIAST